MSTRNPRFKLDENLPSEAQRMLRGDGYDVETVLTEHLGGALDSAVFATCQIEGRVLVYAGPGLRRYPQLFAHLSLRNPGASTAATDR